MQKVYYSTEISKYLQYPLGSKVSRFDSMSDNGIWKEFAKGNSAAFLYIYNKHFDDLYSFGFQFSKDADFIKDCIQDLFVELNQKKKSRSIKSIKSYLFVSLKRKIIYYQNRSKKFIYKTNLLDGYDFQMSFSVEDRLINQQFDKERKAKLNKAINTILTKRQREAIYYLYYERLSIDEMAELMPVSRRGIQNLVYKAVRILKSHFELITFPLWAFFQYL